MNDFLYEKEWDFSTALYDFKCYKCGQEIEWRAYFDADGTSYSGKCWNCKFWYSMDPATVVVTAEKGEPEDFEE